MTLEAKDYVTFTFSGAALALSIYNLLRARLDLTSLNRRTFEQKRFEATAAAAEIVGQYVQIEGTLEGLRFEALRAKSSLVVEESERQIATAKGARARNEDIVREMNALPSSSGALNELLEIEKILGKLKAQKAGVSEYQVHAANFIEDGRRLILAESPPTPPLPAA